MRPWRSAISSTLLLLGGILAAIAATPRAGAQMAPAVPTGTEEAPPVSRLGRVSGSLRERLLGLGAGEPTADIQLHRVRDLVLRRSPGGRRLTEQFYRYAAEMAAASATHLLLRDLGRDWYAAWRDPVHQLVEGHGAETTVTAEQVQTLLDYVAALRAVASPTLRQAIDREMPRLDVSSWVGITMDDWLEQIERLSCEPSDTALCLSGDRFRVEAEWRTPDGRTGRARAVPLTGDTGYFWFFGAANVEAVIKVLDACSTPTPRFWVFAAGLTNVEVDLTVADTVAGTVRAYHNALSTPFQPIQDTAAFSTCAVGGAGAAQWRAASTGGKMVPTPQAESRRGIDLLAWTPRALAAALGESSQPAGAHLGACTSGPDALCLQNGRFRVEVEWQTPDGALGRGQAVPLTSDTGYFWFFRDGNVEQVVKVLDACALSSPRFWVFATGLTNVRVVTTVTDTLRDETRTYVNEQGQAFGPIQDTGAFDTCP